MAVRWCLAAVLGVRLLGENDLPSSWVPPSLSWRRNTERLQSLLAVLWVVAVGMSWNFGRGLCTDALQNWLTRFQDMLAAATHGAVSNDCSSSPRLKAGGCGEEIGSFSPSGRTFSAAAEQHCGAVYL